MKEIILTVSENGETAIETKGFKGKKCLEESSFLKKSLGKELFTELTPSYYEVDGDIVKQKKYLNLCG